MKVLALALLLAACRDGRAPGRCTATFSGNFAETAESPRSCATIVPGTATKLAVTVPSGKLDGPLVVEIDLPPTPVAGRYSPVTVPRWSARGSWLNKACLLAGGTGLARRGSFTLDLHAIDVAARTASGTLTLALPVLQMPHQGCGATMTETVTVQL
jgi:hypothetical protein